ncbi:Alkaline phosphatase [hydrothermal vent metagenome]|uniref:Alkaline phosphatase n=1 Tax=hydrothermal vent metagenome TaxID=652676 RepID=A0A3B0TAE8_9ZZZZ
MKRIYLLLVITLLISGISHAQENYKDKTTDFKTYPGGGKYEVKSYPQKFKSRKPKNVILMIGDGMGVSQVFSGITANGGHLFLENCKYTGFSKTQSSSSYITDSAAGATALSAGVKTYNGAIGVNPDTIPVKTILEEAEEEGLATGLVSTSSITHATPASFIAHQKSRAMYEEIAADFLKTDIDVFIGGGYKHFTKRKDGRNLVNELKGKGYTVLQNMGKIAKIKNGKLAGLTSAEHNGRVNERKDMLPVATETAINILKNDKDGFFLMAEGSQIDWGGHQNNTIYIIEEMLDFDKAIGKALDFAAKDGKTLVIVTADHETGGFALLDGNMGSGMVKGGFVTGGHTGVMVPVFAYGPGAENFTGIMENTDIYHKIKRLLLDE